MTEASAPFHAHIYYDASERFVAERLHTELQSTKAPVTWSTSSLWAR